MPKPVPTPDSPPHANAAGVAVPGSTGASTDISASPPARPSNATIAKPARPASSPPAKSATP